MFPLHHCHDEGSYKS